MVLTLDDKDVRFSSYLKIKSYINSDGSMDFESMKPEIHILLDAFIKSDMILANASIANLDMLDDLVRKFEDYKNLHCLDVDRQLVDKFMVMMADEYQKLGNLL